jgi:hypothetical protein
MSNVFDNRTFNPDEQNAMKVVVDDCVEVLNNISDLNNHMKENVKNLCDRLNEGIQDNELKVKPTLLVKMAKAKIKEKEDLEKSKVAISEVEEGLHVIYRM